MTIRKYDQYQSHFRIVNPLDNIPKDHPCFVVDAVVESLDFSEFNSKYIDTPGMPMYNRKLLLKIDLMGVIDGILSSRKVCEQLLYNDVYKFLAGGHKPNFRTLCISRHDNKEMFEKSMLTLVAMGINFGIVTLEHIATDGTYMKGNASVSQLFTEEDIKIIEELIQERIDIDNNENLLYGDENYGIVEETFYNSIQELINEDLLDYTLEDIKKEIISENDENKAINTLEKEIKKPKLKKISEKIKKVAKKGKSGDQKTLDKISAVKDKLDENWQEKVNMTDPDTFAGKNKKGVYQSLYNVIFSCDYDSKFILATNIADSYVDTNQLIPMIIKLKQMDLITPETIFSADSIFNNGQTLEYLEKENIKALIPDKYEASVGKNKEYEEDNKYHKHNFVYDFENNCYICPEGKVLSFKNQYKDGRKVYYNDLCKKCPVKEECSKKQNTRMITAYKGEQQKQRMKIEMAKPENQKEYKKRSSAAESPIGDIKHNNKLQEFTLRGGENVLGEANKFSFSHNARILAKAISKKGLDLRKIMKKISKSLKNIEISKILPQIFNKITIIITY